MRQITNSNFFQRWLTCTPVPLRDYGHTICPRQTKRKNAFSHINANGCTRLAGIHSFGTSACSDRTKQRYKQGRCKRAYRYDNCCHTLMQTAVPGSPAYIHSAHRHVVIGPNKGINKAVAKGPIVMITAVPPIYVVYTVIRIRFFPWFCQSTESASSSGKWMGAVLMIDGSDETALRLAVLTRCAACADYGPRAVRGAQRHLMKTVFVGTTSCGDIREIFNQPEGAPRPGRVPRGRDAHRENANRYYIYRNLLAA